MIQRFLLKSKILGILVTPFEASRAVGPVHIMSKVVVEDAIWMERSMIKEAGLWPYEQVEVCNITNGARFKTSVRVFDSEEGLLAITGPGSLLAPIDALIEVSSYGLMSEQDLVHYQMKRVIIEGRNRVAGKS